MVRAPHSLTDLIDVSTSIFRAFDGWDQSNNIAGELKNAERNLPRVIHISMGTVLVSAS